MTMVWMLSVVAGGIVTSYAAVQAGRVLRRRTAAGLSLPTWMIAGLSATLWGWYGVHTGLWVLAAWNLVFGVCALVVMWGVLRYVRSWGVWRGLFATLGYALLLVPTCSLFPVGLVVGLGVGLNFAVAVPQVRLSVRNAFHPATLGRAAGSGVSMAGSGLSVAGNGCGVCTQCW